MLAGREGQTASRERQRLRWGDGGEDRRKPDRGQTFGEAPPPDGDAQGISEPAGGRQTESVRHMGGGKTFHPPPRPRAERDSQRQRDIQSG